MVMALALHGKDDLSESDTVCQHLVVTGGQCAHCNLKMMFSGGPKGHSKMLSPLNLTKK